SVVAGSLKKNPEVVSNRVNGLLVYSGDERELANACAALTSDRDLAGRLSANGRRTVGEAFSQARSGEALTRVYKDIVSAGRAGDSGVPARPATRGGAPGRIPQVIRALTHWVFHRIACVR